METKTNKNKRFAIVLGVLVIAGATFGITKYIHSQHHEETVREIDDLGRDGALRTARVHFDVRDRLDRRHDGDAVADDYLVHSRGHIRALGELGPLG